MRRLLLAALLAALVPAAAAAGPTLALRLGYESSAGQASKGTPMSEVAASVVPVAVDALWQFGPHFSAGVYSSFAIGQVSREIADRCDALGASCSVWTARVGVRGEYAFPELSELVAPWIGLGTGWEWVDKKVSRAGVSASQMLSGWETMSLEAGTDVKVAPKLWLGPYLGLRLGQYGRLDGYSIVNQAWHQWYGFGIRGRWSF